MLYEKSSVVPHKICIKCSRSSLYVYSESAIVCRACGKEYPIVEGIPVFVDDLDEHQRQLEKSKVGRESWYESEQIVSPEQDSYFHIKRMINAELSNLYRKHVGTDKEILDLGCGDGRNGSFLRTVGSKVNATDYNLLRLQRSKLNAQTYDDIFMSMIQSLPLPDNYCQVIHFDNVLEHISEPEIALNSVYRVLRDDGVLMLGVPNEGCWYHQLKFWIKPSLLSKTDHVNFFTLSTITDLLNKCGFKVIEARGMGWGTPVMGNNPLLKTFLKIWARFRRYAWYNEIWEIAGRLVLPKQYFLLYVVAKKKV